MPKYEMLLLPIILDKKYLLLFSRCYTQGFLKHKKGCLSHTSLSYMHNHLSKNRMGYDSLSPVTGQAEVHVCMCVFIFHTTNEMKEEWNLVDFNSNNKAFWFLLHAWRSFLSTLCPFFSVTRNPVEMFSLYKNEGRGLQKVITTVTRRH